MAATNAMREGHAVEISAPSRETDQAVPPERR
jgi:hypothetical protein